ncbi:MAG: response regulator [Planctomycetes bacterium]|jgi:PAS domain S-box-containing protein|nr:response regulator [Planctomycetota bacterium]
MRRTLPIMLVAIGFGLLFWVVDASWDYIYFAQDLREIIYSQPLTFWDSLILNVPRDEIYNRTAFMLACLLGGMVVAVYVRRLQATADALRHREADLANAQRLANLGNWTWYPKTDQFTWSPNLFEIFDRDPALGPYSPGQFAEYIHEDDRERYLDVVSRAAAGEAKYVTMEYRMHCHDGTIRHHQTIAQVDRDDRGQAIRVFGTTQDITSRRRDAERIRESERTWRSLMHSIQAGVAVHRADTTLVNCNTRLCQYLGLSEQQMLGRDTTGSTWALYREDESEMPAEEYPVNRVRATRQPIRNMILGATPERPEGMRWLLVNADPVFDSDGELSEIIVTSTDVTDRRKSDEQRRELEAQIQHAQKLESLGVLAGGIAHDFNNLLVGILGNADLALTELSPVSPARESVQQIEISARRAADLCRQMLAYSGKGRFVIEPIDLSEVVEEMGHMLTVAISKNVVLKYNLPDDLPAVMADATQIRQVVMNLITNASEAIGDRSGVISVSTNAMECTQECLDEAYAAEDLSPGMYVALEVSDTGCGMDAETLAKLFDPFYTTKFTGRGLGLAAVLGIIRGHGGAIKVDGEPGRGSTFTVLLPASAESAVCRPAQNDADDAWQGKGTILLADDEETIRAVGKRMLEHLGFDVLTATDGRQALDILDEHRRRITAVILDLTMPRLSGEEAFRELRQRKIDVPAIMSSGYNEQEVAERFLGKGMAGFIHKPYQIHQLQAVLRDVIDGDTPATNG